MNIVEDSHSSAKVVEEFITAWNARELDRAFQMLSEDAVWDDPAMSAPAAGRQGIRAFAEAVLSAFPNFAITLRGPICSSSDGATCAVPWRIKATHLRPLAPGYGPTRRSATIDGIDYIQFRGSQIASIETFFDLRAAASQLLGVQLRPRPGSFRERLLVSLQRVVAAIVRFFSPAPKA
jgi:steroid delta-isomerase-like uncharacterized protein